MTLDKFLFAIETQMASAIHEIGYGCQPHSKAIFSKRDELLKAELAMLLRGQQGVFLFLDHCSSMIFVKNDADIERFFELKRGEAPDQLDRLWVRQNEYSVGQAMICLFHRLTGSPINDIVPIASTIEEWTFIIVQTTR